MPAPRKRFGQNFLQDDAVIAQIIHAIAPTATDHLIEIGPGQGALTQHLAPAAGRLDCIELDRDLVPLLSRWTDLDHVHCLQADALSVDFAQFSDQPNHLRIVGNLPYNISTPLLFHLLSFKSLIRDLHFMLQKEVVDRICAPTGNKHYGRLSVMLQTDFSTTALFDVPPNAFYPAPKVQSAVVRLVPIHQPTHHLSDPAGFQQLVKQAFSQRRKTLRNALKGLVGDSEWTAAGLDASLRPEQLSPAEYVHLANVCARVKPSS